VTREPSVGKSTRKLLRYCWNYGGREHIPAFFDDGAVADPKLKARLTELGGSVLCSVLPGSPADFGKRIADETEK
jgi:hypothetical protein